jgi:Fe-S oxidoreductase
MPVEIVKVENNSMLKRFVRFNYELYKDNPYSVPDLYEDTMNTLRKDRNAAFEFCDADYFLALRNGKVVGRVAAIINRRANEKWGQKAARFGWIDFIDDREVSAALIGAVEQWARERYATLNVKASACIGCGVCETRCPYHLPIRQMLKDCAEKFGK